MPDLTRLIRNCMRRVVFLYLFYSAIRFALPAQSLHVLCLAGPSDVFTRVLEADLYRS